MKTGEPLKVDKKYLSYWYQRKFTPDKIQLNMEVLPHIHQCFENDDHTLDPDLLVNGFGKNFCKEYFAGNEENMKKYYIKMTMEQRGPAKKQEKKKEEEEKSAAQKTAPLSAMSQRIKEEIDALKEQLDHLDKTIINAEMREELKEDLKVNFKKRMAKLYGIDQE